MTLRPKRTLLYTADKSPLRFHFAARQNPGKQVFSIQFTMKVLAVQDPNSKDAGIENVVDNFETSKKIQDPQCRFIVLRSCPRQG
jgi:hypothetical protein